MAGTATGQPSAGQGELGEDLAPRIAQQETSAGLRLLERLQQPGQSEHLEVARHRAAAGNGRLHQTLRFARADDARRRLRGGRSSPGAPTAPETATSVVGAGEPEGLVEATVPGRSSMSGDLEVFGLAGLLQSFQQSETSGRLLLRDARGQVFAELSLSGGRLASCRAGHLVDNAAFFQLFEMPTRGTFEFVRSEPGRTATPARARSSACCSRRCAATTSCSACARWSPTRCGCAPPAAGRRRRRGDRRRSVRRLWELARGGASTAECESAVAVDSYRVRSLLAHWLEQNALAPAS